MSYTVLARKYRPQKFADVIGQDHVVRTLKNALEQKRIAHGYIFSGHRGIGKTTIARILAMALNCKSSPDPVSEPCGVCDSCREIRDGSVGAMDVIEIDAATNRGIEEVRGLIATATAEPARDRYRIFILDEAHQVTDAAFNALLKTLEEPPSWVVFMMATTQPEDIPQTIRSRCQHFSFHAVRFEEILNHLREIAKTENLTVDEEALALLAEAGDGSMRDALSIMDQAISCSGNVLTGDIVRGLIGNVSSEVLERVMHAVHQNSSDEVLRIVDKLMVEGQSATHFARQLVRFLRNALVAKVSGTESPVLQISSDEKKRVGGIAELFSEEDLTRFLQSMLRTYGDVSYKQEQRFHLELGLLKLVHAQRLLPMEQLLSGVRLQEASAAPSHSAAPSRSGASSHAAPSHATPTRSAPPGFSSQRPAGVPPMGGGSSPFAKPAPSKPSPLEADQARRGREDMSSAPASPFHAPPAPKAFAPAGVTSIKPVFDNGSNLAIAPRVEAPRVDAPRIEASAAPLAAAAPASSGAPLDVDALRDAVLAALEGNASQMLIQAMEEGEWVSENGALVVKVEMSDSMVSISYTRDQEKVANQAAARIAGRHCKVRLMGGAAPAAASAKKPRAMRTGGADGYKTRALEEPVVKRMMEKFGAEVRIVMDRSSQD